MNPTKEEIERIRAIRREICEEFNNDPARMVSYYRKVEEQLRKEGYEFVGAAKQGQPLSARVR
ncbi:MAG: hypothetical protein HY360_22440 [Verrucomicrobia bacterium]|nr:hypothetical protein [Verrucomicrobiota bacterium]